MKVWFNWCVLEGTYDDSNVKFGLGWYKHYKGHPYKGLTIEFYIFSRLIQLNWVNNWAEYDKTINYRKYRSNKK